MNRKLYIIIAFFFGIIGCDKEVDTSINPANYKAPEAVTANGSAEFILNGRKTTSEVLMTLTQDTLKGISEINTIIYLNGRSALNLALETNPHYEEDIMGNIPALTVYTINVNKAYQYPATQYVVRTEGVKFATTEASNFSFSDNYCAPLKIFVDKVDTLSGEINLSTPLLEFCDEDLQRVIFEDVKISAVNQ